MILYHNVKVVNYDQHFPNFQNILSNCQTDITMEP